MKNLVSRRRLAYDTVADEAPPPQSRPGAGASAGQRINPTVSAAVIAEARNALDAAHTSGDYRFQSVGDLIRAALRAHAEGLRLTQQARGGRKKRHTVELPAELLGHYEALPSRSRGVIIERALLSFLAQGFERG
ncbi:MAG: hypothetical protein GY719_06165 [bacterium]|nr:hypothetical protein [bacterium]